MIPVECFIALSTILFFLGVFGFVTRRNLVAMLISIELVLNSVDLNFAVFNRMLFPGQMEGMFFTLFSIGVSAAETAVALANNGIQLFIFNTSSAFPELFGARSLWYEDEREGCFHHWYHCAWYIVASFSIYCL